ncbi:MAG TPA: exodeoxyribonuclease VII large subunit [Frankiaceae bacterium]|nr:exodeoxyribonuclease VII large subunit [Frankiaceae bacterium]
MGAESSPESPLPVRTVARMISAWVAKLGRVWIEGQITEVSRRSGMRVAFLTLRDPVADVSLRVAAGPAMVEGLREGARVVLWGQPEMHLTRGSLQLVAHEIRPVGAGELLARIERLKSVFAAEGLFAASRKRPLPFLPHTVGLITGRGSAAERDVVENARRRWPAVRIALREVAVQGPFAVTEVSDAIRVLDRDPEIDVIVIARGGGSLEDLLPFSDEALCRLVSASLTPIVSAIGHEQDTPLLDLVADVRASTPTDAAKHVVPDVGEQAQAVAQLRARARRAATGRLDAEQARIHALASRPALRDPQSGLVHRAQEIAALVARSRRTVQILIEREDQSVQQQLAQVRALSPAATLARGYAVVQQQDGTVLRDAATVSGGERLAVRLADGRLDVEVVKVVKVVA